MSILFRAAARDGYLPLPAVLPSALTIGVRIAIILTSLALIASFTAIALIEPETPKAALAACGGIDNDARRLACYDRLARGAMPQPAKGANPPVLLPSSHG